MLVGDKNKVLIVSYSIPRVELWSFIEPVRLKGAKLSTPKSFSCKQVVVKATVITEIADFFDNNETEIRQNMSFFVEVYCNFIYVFFFSAF